MDAPSQSSPSRTSLGQRILIVGSTNSGKTTLAIKLSNELDLPHVELDSLNWQAEWVSLQQTDPEVFRGKIRAATEGERWIISGNYHQFSQEIIWPRVETIIWLDLPRSLLTRRLLLRSWRRWRTRELLWGNNREQFWPQLAIWNDDSLLRWLWTNYEPKRQRILAAQEDPQWSRIQFISLKSPREMARL